MLSTLAILSLQGELERPSARATRTERAPRIDGVLEPEVWRDPPTIGELTQVLPRNGEPPSERTEVRILYDDAHVYLGVRCFDREPHLIVATQAARDAELNPDDRLEIVLDTFLDRRSAFYFQMSPAGSKGDALLTNDGGDYNKPWDGIWEGKAAIDAEGWVAEIAIPLKTLSFRSGATTWGFNIARYIKRRNEVQRWSSPQNDAQLFQVSRAGLVSGFEGLRQGLGLDVVPFAAATASKERQGSNHDEDLIGHGGADVFYKLSPSLTAVLTLNTDFAETEVDERQLNLTRFPLFFPEKRDFFLQDAGLFRFADLGNDLIPFFSRRIGRSPAGTAIPIDVGVKLTGRPADWNVGVLDVETGDGSGIDGENLFVARLSRNVGAQSTVGAILTHGDPASSLDNTLVGVDANWRTNDGWFGKRSAASAWWLGSDSEGVDGGQGAFGASLSYPNDRIRWSLSARQIDEHFQPALGFVPRVGVRRYSGSFYFQPRMGGALRQLSFGVDDTLFTDLDDHLETHEATFLLCGAEFESGDEVRLELDEGRQVLDQPFTIQPGVTLPARAYDDTRLRLEWETSQARPLSLEASIAAGEFLEGDSTSLAAELSWRPSARFNAAFEWIEDDIRYDQGDVETQVARTRLDFHFSPDLSWTNFIQWDSQSDAFGLNSRWRWIPKPGQEFFLVFNQTQENTDSFHPLFQSLAFKASYTFRF